MAVNHFFSGLGDDPEDGILRPTYAPGLLLVVGDSSVLRTSYRFRFGIAVWLPSERLTRDTFVSFHVQSFQILSNFVMILRKTAGKDTLSLSKLTCCGETQLLILNS